MPVVSLPQRRPARTHSALLALAFALAGAALFGPGCASTPALQQPRQDPGSGPARAPRTDIPEVFRGAGTTDPFPVHIRYVQTAGEQELTASGELVVTSHDLGLRRLFPGTWRISTRATAATRFVYPVFVKAFQHNEASLVRDEFEHWRRQGYTPSITTLGRTITGRDGTLYDGRLYWLAVKRCATQSEADALKKRLQGDKVWAWTREEVLEAAKGVVTLRSMPDREVIQTEAPLALRSEGTMAFPDARKGQAPLVAPGPIDVVIDRTGAMALYGELPLEEYVRGILPAEVYAEWPMEALKAQAVAARSEIIVHASGKHYFEGYDFCIEQHCRAFAGRAGEASRTNEAAAATAGQILIDRDHGIIPTVFSSDCGGWTENNENVWDGEADPALRGRPDFATNAARSGSYGQNDAARWLSGSPHAYCDGDKEYYRWTRNISLAKLSAQFNRDYGIGNLKRVEVLERGVSGRLKSIRLVGDRKSAEVRKELNIRRAFENLPSALCTIAVEKGAVQIRGAGRGHGVGLCQHGAYGMARENFSYDDILRHYFTGASIARL